MTHTAIIDHSRIKTYIRYIICILTHFLFGVSAKHLSEEVSTTVSQNETTGSATLISKKEYHIIKLDSLCNYPYIF